MLNTVIFFALILSPLVFFHELGHYLASRLFNVAVARFSVGFGPVLLRFMDRRGTEWAFSLLPLGGYIAPLSGTEGPEVRRPVGRPMNALKRWQRAVILISGPVANAVLGVLLIGICLYSVGVSSTPPVLASIMAGSPAASAGLQAGDRILHIQGHQIDTFSDIQTMVRFNLGSPIQIEYARGTAHYTTTLTPHHTIQMGEDGRRMDQGELGVTSPKPTYRDVSLTELPGLALQTSWDTTVLNLTAIGQMIEGIRTTDGLSGVIGMVQMTSHMGGHWVNYVYFGAILSLNLMMINLFPIAILDGGQILILGIEGLLRRELPPLVLHRVRVISMAAVCGLMLFTTAQDLLHVLPHL